MKTVLDFDFLLCNMLIYFGQGKKERVIVGGINVWIWGLFIGKKVLMRGHSGPFPGVTLHIL